MYSSLNLVKKLGLVAAFSLNLFFNSAFALESRSICGQTVTSNSYTGAIPSWLDGNAVIYNNDGSVSLGVVSSNAYATNSILNQYGNYGSSYSSSSIFNEYGTYGSSYGSYSACNSYASPYSVPQIWRNGSFIGYLTKNQYTSGAIDPATLVGALLKQGFGSSVVADLSAPTIPTGFTGVAVSPTQINFTWNASSDNVGVTAYLLYSGNVLSNVLSASPTSLALTSLTPATAYTFKLAACDAAANCSALSTSLSITTPAIARVTTTTVSTTTTTTQGGVNSNAQGFWTGTTSTGWNGAVAILETGETWGIYSVGNLIYGAIYGGTLGSGNSIYGSGSDFYIPNHSVTSGTYTGTVNAKSSISIITSGGVTFNGSYMSSYDQAASIAAVAGTYTGNVVTKNIATQASTVTISSNGVISSGSQADGCVVTGTATPRVSGKNVFDISLQHNGINCSIGNGATTTGIAVVDTRVSPYVLYAISFNSNKSDGLLWVGGKSLDVISSSTTTTTASSTTTTTTTTTLSNNIVSLRKGWNLVGNGMDQSIDVASVFGDKNLFTTVWKWIASSSRWAFYAPSMDSAALAAYAQNKGYDVLTNINAGDGYWVNAAQQASFNLSSASRVNSERFASTGNLSLQKGWSLIAVGDSPLVSDFNLALGGTPPSAGSVPVNLTTLWAWDAAVSNWMFFAPSLVNNGTLNSYITTKGYLPFGTKALEPSTGFWVNMP